MVAIGVSFNLEGGKGVLVSLLAFVALYAVSLGPITWVIVSEIFPTRVRGAAASACMVVMYLADFAVTLTFPSVMEWLGKGAFYLFAAICAGAAIFILALVPETKGKSLEEIESMWARRERAGAEAARRSP
jgi:SP family arabinose:H+ symporter-like MFS transporter